jgi:DNA-binding MarR family transcriptional regulator
MEESLGVTGPQRLVLRLVGRFPHCSAGDLAGWLHIHPSTLTGILQRLESRELLLRAVDVGDRRRVRLELTAAGEAINADRSGTVEAAVRRTLMQLDDSQKAVAQQVLERLVEELDRGADKPHEEA